MCCSSRWAPRSEASPSISAWDGEHPVGRGRVVHAEPRKVEVLVPERVRVFVGNGEARSQAEIADPADDGHRVGDGIIEAEHLRCQCCQRQSLEVETRCGEAETDEKILLGRGGDVSWRVDLLLPCPAQLIGVDDPG